jgi:conjugative transfer region lipoprotein (TIGR03751 family)
MKTNPFPRLVVMPAAAMCLAGLVAGCSVSGPRESPLPKTGPKMIDIFKQHMKDDGTTPGDLRDRLPARSYDEGRGTPSMRNAATSSLHHRFARLPNPDLEMYVYPHLAAGKYPVPGYTTLFPMFETIQYAMPGEVAPQTMPPAPPARRMDNSSARANDALGPAPLESPDPEWPHPSPVSREDPARDCGRHITLAQPNTAIEHAVKPGNARYAATRSNVACAIE